LAECWKNLDRKFYFKWNLTRITATLREDVCTCVVIFRWIIFGVGNVRTRILQEIKTHILSRNFVFQKILLLWVNVEVHARVRQATEENKMRGMRFACWIPKVTNIHSEYVIRIALPR
jgi:hypothetical protein